MQRQYLCIDLKSFYTSVECVQRGLDPMTARLVVADPKEGENAVCMAVSPALKKMGYKNHCRLKDIPGQLRYITAPPCMKRYIDCSADIYGIYLKYFSKDDIHVYSVDEAFMDATGYLTLYAMDAKKLAKTVIADIRQSMGLRAACGIGTNLYLTKIALDLLADNATDFIGELNEETYRKLLWDHQPLTDFWRIGPGIPTRLARSGIFTMRDIALGDEKLFYSMFGKDAELLIDHAWGRETATISDIKAWQAETKSLSSRQTLIRDCDFEAGRQIVREMTATLSADLSEQYLTTRSLSLHIGYSDGDAIRAVKGNTVIAMDTNLAEFLVPAAETLYMRIGDRKYNVRQVKVCFNDVAPEHFA